MKKVLTIAGSDPGGGSQLVAEGAFAIMRGTGRISKEYLQRHWQNFKGIFTCKLFICKHLYMI